MKLTEEEKIEILQHQLSVAVKALMDIAESNDYIKIISKAALDKIHRIENEETTERRIS